MVDQLANLGPDEFLFLGAPRAAGRERDLRDLKRLER
jgi:hypothetical protein